MMELMMIATFVLVSCKVVSELVQFIKEIWSE